MAGLLLLLLPFACATAQEIDLRQIASGFSAPTDIQNAGDGSNRLFLVEQAGRIRILRNGSIEPQPFLNIAGRTRAGGERGLLGLAFPPDYASKQRFYVNYTNLAGDTVVAMYRVGANPDLADASSETILLTIAQPFSNHNGGQIRFGPDGFLYIGMGDGGSGGDPQGNAQNRQSLLGKMLRLDVESQPGRALVPAGNPFAGSTSTRAEIWALGLRNPWRFSFDRQTGDLWIGDVGQNAWEEIDFQPASSPGGENYGWNVMEGANCFQTGCSMQGLVLPVAQYRNPAEGCSVTGGFVYRGPSYPGLRGTYLYGDYCSGRIWGLLRERDAWVNRLLLDSNASISTFGEDEAGELYLADAGRGILYRIESSRGPVFSSSNVVNAASYTPGIAPGSAASIFLAGLFETEGVAQAVTFPLPTALNGVRVLVDGVAAPLFAAGRAGSVEQINFQAPFELSGHATASISVEKDGLTAGPVVVPVQPFHPAVFTSDGTQAIAVRLPGYELVAPDRPLTSSEHLFVYATGLGPVRGTPPTGAAGPAVPPSETSSQVEATIGGIAVPVSFAGLAPGLVGVYQVNLQMPAGPFEPSPVLRLTVGGQPSPPVRLP